MNEGGQGKSRVPLRMRSFHDLPKAPFTIVSYQGLLFCQTTRARNGSPRIFYPTIKSDHDHKRHLRNFHKPLPSDAATCKSYWRETGDQWAGSATISRIKACCF